MTSELTLAARYALALPRFLVPPLSSADSRALVAAEHDRAPDTFLDTLGRAVFAHPGSPYLPLLERAGIGLDLARSWVAADGIAGALERLFDAGVRISLAEFKGREPVRRPGLEYSVCPGDFDNPLPGPGFSGATGGSTGAPRRLSVDLAGVRAESAYYRLLLEGFGATTWPNAIWRPVPPGVTGLKAVLRSARAGAPVERWFAPNRFAAGVGGVRGRSIVAVTLAACRRRGLPAPWPRYVSSADPGPVVRWLGEAVRRAPGAVLQCTASSAVRVCSAAERSGVSIAGTLFRLGGEPFTEATRQRLEAVGARGATFYSMTEVGNIGAPCAEAPTADALHVLDGKIALIAREQTLSSGERVSALYITSLSSDTSKFMLNVETGDAGRLEPRRCACPFGSLGLRQGLASVRSYEKLTCAGMTVMAADIVRLVEESLPARFGGRPVDYQLVEDDARAESRLALRVAPGVGHLREEEITEFVLGVLAELGRAERMMAEIWRSAGTLSLERRDPHVTDSGKTPAVIARSRTT